MTTKIINVLDPTAKVIGIEAKIAPRVSDLNGKVIGFLDNAKPNASVFLARVEELLSQRYKFAKVIRVRKSSNPTDLAEKLSAKFDAVVNGVGD